jgi:hypothetical protein
MQVTQTGAILTLYSDINTNNVGSYTGLYWYMVCHHPSALEGLLLTFGRTPDTSKPKHTVRACTARTLCTSAEVELLAPASIHPSSPTLVSLDMLLHLRAATSRVQHLAPVLPSNGLSTGRCSVRLFFIINWLIRTGTTPLHNIGHMLLLLELSLLLL